MAAPKRAAADGSPVGADTTPGWSSRQRLAGALAAGVVGAVAMGLAAGWSFAALVGWDAACVTLMAATWATVATMNAERTAQFAVREEPGRAITDLLLVAASVASLLGVGFVVAAGGGTSGAKRGFLVALTVLTVVLSWSVVHTTYTLRYARLYYTGASGGIDFNAPGDEAPRYLDFAYLAFTVGMTFQVSDTALKSKVMRATVLRHALLSYLFGVFIIAVMINLVAGLTK